MEKFIIKKANFLAEFLRDLIIILNFVQAQISKCALKTKQIREDYHKFYEESIVAFAEMHSRPRGSKKIVIGLDVGLITASLK